MAKIEVTLVGEAARLYEILLEAASSSVKPSQVNRAALETGLTHHVLMLAAVGAITGERRDEAHALVEQISKRTIMRDLFAHAREYWENQSGTGLIKPENQAE